MFVTCRKWLLCTRWKLAPLGRLNTRLLDATAVAILRQPPLADLCRAELIPDSVPEKRNSVVCGRRARGEHEGGSAESQGLVVLASDHGKAHCSCQSGLLGSARPHPRCDCAGLGPLRLGRPLVPIDQPKYRSELIAKVSSSRLRTRHLMKFVPSLLLSFAPCFANIATLGMLTATG